MSTSIDSALCDLCICLVNSLMEMMSLIMDGGVGTPLREQEPPPSSSSSSFPSSPPLLDRCNRRIYFGWGNSSVPESISLSIFSSSSPFYSLSPHLSPHLSLPISLSLSFSLTLSDVQCPGPWSLVLAPHSSCVIAGPC